MSPIRSAAEYVIQPDLILIVLHGDITDADLYEAQRRLFADPAFRGRLPRLVDGTHIGQMRTSSEGVRRVARAAVERGMRKIALVASQDVVYGLMRLYEGYACEADCYVSRDVLDAIQWLNMPDEEIALQASC